ncbi:MAG: response regulator [Gloeotrichia echinulata IR180]|jgi:DNA-binding response OmpR family regulator|nr:response regulator [Gloeotrichia echinulata DEX184]
MYKILVIEHDFLLLELLEEWLILHGFCALIAMTSQEGYELTRLEEPDIILCNYRLPDANGLELRQRIQQNLEIEIPFILMTEAEVENIPNWHNYLHDKEILLKPFSPKLLLQVLYSKLPSVPSGIRHCQSVIKV